HQIRSGCTRRGGAVTRRLGKQALRIEWRDVCGKIGNGERQIAGDAHEGAYTHNLVVADTIDGGNADHLTRESRFFSGWQTVAFVGAFFRAPERTTARYFDTLG